MFFMNANQVIRTMLQHTRIIQIAILLVVGVAVYLVAKPKYNVEETSDIIKNLETTNVELVKNNHIYESKMKVQDEQVNQLKATMEEMKKNLQHKDNMLEKTGSQMNAKEGSINGLESTMRELREDKKRLHDIIESRGKEIEAITERNKEQNTLLKNTQEMLTSAQTQLKEYKTELQKHQDELKKAVESNNLAQTELTKSREQTTQLMDELSKSKIEMSKASIELSDAKTELRILKDLPGLKNPMQQQAMVQDNSTSDLIKLLAVLSVVVVFVMFIVYVWQRNPNANTNQ